MIKRLLMSLGRIIVGLGVALLVFKIFESLVILNKTHQFIIDTTNIATALSTICSGALLMGFSYLLDAIDGINVNIFKLRNSSEKDENANISQARNSDEKDENKNVD